MKHEQSSAHGREPARIDGVCVELLNRISTVMNEHYPKVLAANRFFEEETGIHNEIGSNNLNDALSHLGTLFEAADDMTFEQQSNEVHDFEGHLRRGMMESYEQVFRMRLGEIAVLWQQHLRIARPLIERGKLHGVPTGAEVDRLRRKCMNLLDDGRAAKRGHDWAAWDKGTESLAAACQMPGELSTALDQGIAAAAQRRATGGASGCLSRSASLRRWCVCHSAGGSTTFCRAKARRRFPRSWTAGLWPPPSSWITTDCASRSIPRRTSVRAASSPPNFPDPGTTVDTGSIVTLDAACP